jgi:16S rRNA (guanine1207-N2)-methyltransferase
VRTPYELELESRVAAGPDRYAFRTADGVVSKDAFRDAELALLGAVVPAVDDDVLVVDANYGVVGCILADVAPEGRTVLAETSAHAARLCERNLADNGSPGDVALVASLPEIHGDETGDVGFDVVAYAPKPYDPVPVVAERICGALDALRTDGECYVAAGKNAGAARYREVLAELTGDVERVARNGDVRVYRATRTAGFEPREYVEERVFEAAVRGVGRTFVTRPGLFSAGHLDGGTRLLLEDLPVADGDRVLDLACGYGPVGLFAAGVADCEVAMTDDDAVAVAYAGRNAERNGVALADAMAADCVEGVRGRTFDLVASNPPTHAGSGVVDACFRGARDVLADDGRFALVYNDVLGYEDRLADLFGDVEVARHENDFHVTVCRRPG